MNSFTIRLQDATRSEEVTGVVSFVGTDASGSFGVLAGHARMMTCLGVGLAKFATENGTWKYVALPGAVLYFKNNLLTLNTRHYLVDEDYTHVSNALEQQLLTEEKKLLAMKLSLRRMEEEMLKRLWSISRAEGR